MKSLAALSLTIIAAAEKERSLTMAEKEYIEREALVERLKKEECDCEWLWTILDIPAADVEPVKHGHWYNRGGRFRCSVCDNKALLKDIGGTGGWSHEYEQQKSPYCPNCGAKMDGE